MEFRSQKIKITIGGIQVVAELKPNRTAQAILDALPIHAPVNQWGSPPPARGAGRGKTLHRPRAAMRRGGPRRRRDP